MAKLVLEHVGKVIDDVRVLDDMTLTIEDGEVMTVVGPFGCGHTLLLRLIAGLEPASQGVMILDGEDINHWHPDERAAALVFPAAIAPHQSVDHYLRLNPALLRSPSLADRRIAWVAERLGLSALLHQSVGNLNAAQYMSLQIAWAAVGEPPVILIRDLLDGLNTQARDRLRRTLYQQLRSLETTVIYATHQAVDALALGDRVVVLRDGRIEQAGPPTEIYCDPQNMFVAGYMGQPLLNRISATIEQAERGLAARTEDGFQLSLPADCDHRLADYIGRDVVLGIRPEAMMITTSEERLGPSCVIRGTVLTHEYQGAATLLNVQMGATELWAHIAQQCHFRSGEEVSLAVDPEQLLIFDKYTDRAITQ